MREGEGRRDGGRKGGGGKLGPEKGEDVIAKNVARFLDLGGHIFMLTYVGGMREGEDRGMREEEKGRRGADGIITGFLILEAGGGRRGEGRGMMRRRKKKMGMN
jgi:hypothetical protein